MVTIDLSKISFDYDFFSTTMPDGSTLILNLVDEDFISEGTEVIVNRINVVVAPSDGSENVLCSPVIGIENDNFIIDTDYEEYKGDVLTKDNMQYCTLTMYGENDE